MSVVKMEGGEGERKKIYFLSPKLKKSKYIMASSQPLRNCGSPLNNVHSDWKWSDGDFGGKFVKPLDGITWASIRQLAFMDGVFPTLDSHIKSMHSYSAHYGLQKYVEMDFDSGHTLNCMIGNCGEMETTVTRDKDKIDVNFLGGPENYPPCVNALYDASNIASVECTIDHWLSPEAIERHLTAVHDRTPVLTYNRMDDCFYGRGTISQIGTPAELSIIARTYAVILLALNNSIIKQSRGQLTYISP
jgi:hypothetical protein